MNFDWDTGNTAKCTKHGLTREAIEFALSNGAQFASDPVHSLTEQRFIAVSRTAEGRPVYIAFCWRGERIRPISARYMHRKEALRHGH
jgi:hypothetical protein